MNVNRKTSFQILLDEWRLLNFYGKRPVFSTLLTR